MATRGIQYTSEHPFEDDRLLVSASEAARLLDVCAKTIQRLPIQRVKVGKATRYRVSDLLEIAQRGTPTARKAA